MGHLAYLALIFLNADGRRCWPWSEPCDPPKSTGPRVRRALTAA